ncbi:MAG: PAS domain S-box protein [Candidatus Acidiferrales bacterium]
MGVVAGSWFEAMRKSETLFRYFLAIVATFVALYLRYLLMPLLGNQNPYHTAWLAVVFSAWYCGIGPAIVSTLIATLGVDYWFLSPFHSFAIQDRTQVYGMLGFLAFSGAIIALGESNRRGFGARARLAAIVESSDDAIISKNLDGIITSWNKGAERVFGYTAAEAAGKHITLIIPPEHRDEEAMILERLRRGERIEHFETVRVRKDGSTLDVSLTISPVKDAVGLVIGASKVARDITQQRQAARALRESEERFRAIFETTPECVKLVAPDGTLLHMNASGLKMIGADCLEMAVGKSIYDLIDPKDRERFRALNEKVCRGEKGYLELDVVGFKGERRRMETHAAPMRNTDGTVVQLGVTRDITERKLAEDAVKEKELSVRLLKLQDEERRRIARELHDGVGQLLAAMTMNAARLNQEKARLSPEAARSLEDNSRLMHQISSDIRTMSYLFHPPLLDEMGLGSALKWYVTGFTERSKIATKLEVSADVERLPQDYELCLFRIAQECLTNIHRHSGSSIALVRLLREDGEIKLEVSDEGAGISAATQSKVAAGETAGVGLRGMRERVRQLGGRLEIYSNGKGTTVTASVPYAEAEQSADGLPEDISDASEDGHPGHGVAFRAPV